MLKKLIIPMILCVLAVPLVGGTEDQENRLKSFLELYCRTYESKDIDKFITFFTSDATENNRPFHELVPKYRRNMKRIKSFTYRIELDSYSIQAETGNVRIKGKYFTQYLGSQETWKKNSGNISMELVNSGDSYLVKRLNYIHNPEFRGTFPVIGKEKEMVFDIGEYYVALGDSITKGIGDDIFSDNNSFDGKIEGSGYPPILSDMLTQSRGHRVFIANEGRSGETSAGGAYRIQSVIDNHPKAQYFLIQYGTNDSGGLIPYPNDVKLMLDKEKDFRYENKESMPSGLGLKPGNSGYVGSFKDNIQQIINAILAAGKKPILAKVPIVIEYQSNIDKTPRNLLIQEYNKVIDELVSRNGIKVTPPDFYNHFKKNKDQFHDRFHPNGKGYQSMAKLWFKALNRDLSQRRFLSKKKPKKLSKKKETKKDVFVKTGSNIDVSGKKEKNKRVSKTDSEAKNQEIIFKVQIMSSEISVSTDSPKFKGLKNIWEYQHQGRYNYTVGNKRDLQSAIELQSEIRKKGFSSAFVVAFQNGKRISMKGALDIYKTQSTP